MLYGHYCYIIIENFPQKFSPCIFHTTRHNVAYAMAQWTPTVGGQMQHFRISNITMIYRLNIVFFMLVNQTSLYLVFNNTNNIRFKRRLNTQQNRMGATEAAPQGSWECEREDVEPRLKLCKNSFNAVWK